MFQELWAEKIIGDRENPDFIYMFFKIGIRNSKTCRLVVITENKLEINDELI